MNGKKIKTHISGVCNSSDIGLDFGKLHNQIQTLEHSRLDFTTTGAANDFFHTFSNFISAKNILSNLLLIILPCIVRILQQNIQKMHLAVLRNKKGGDAGSQREELCPWQRSRGRRLGICKGRIKPQESPWKFLSIYPQNQSLPTLLLCALTYTSDFTGDCPPPSLSEKELNYSSS